MNLSSNRINQNQGRGGRPGRPIPQRATQPQPQRPQVQQANTLSNYGTTTKIRSLTPGQLLKGEVTDLRNSEVVVTLENNTTVAGKLLNGSWLSIGDTAAFKVASASQEVILLEAVPKSELAIANSTVQKALEAAGLPKTDKNQQVVLELMKNQLPINKQQIQHTLQQSFQNKDVSISTLVIMDKLKIPITQQNATQFEVYQTNQHSIAARLEDLSQSLTKTIKQLATTTPATHAGVTITPTASAEVSSKNALIDQLMNKGQSSTIDNSSFQSTTAHILSSLLDYNSSASDFSRTVLPDAVLTLSENAQNELLSILENFELPEELQQAIQDNTASLREVIHLLHKDFEQAYLLDLENMPSEEASEGAIENTSEETMLRTSLFDVSVVRELEEQFSQMQADNNELGGRMDAFTRIDFNETIEKFPLDEALKEKISSGEINTNEFLRAIKTVLPFTDASAAAALISNDIFEGILRDTFMNSLLLTPEEIFKNGGVDNYYRKLSKQLEELDDALGKQLLQQTRVSNDPLANILQHEARDTISQLKDNLDFMKVINQFFSYVQLPVKLQEKFTHADLYVYTKRKNLAEQNNPIHVLLRLDMDNLGKLDVDIRLKDRTLTTNYAVSDERSRRLFETNINLINDKLLELGYFANSTVTVQNQDIDIVKDFLNPTSASQGFSRYSFDLRA